MIEVKRFDHVNHAHVDDCEHIENPEGAWVKASDYDALAAEAQALREEVAALKARMVTPEQVPNGYIGWVTQYPGRAAKLWGAREIAELNWWPEDGQQLFRVVEVERIAAPAQGDNDE
ncbi:hypothetical protein IPC563_05295 [Pseudomonas aeruginosa]|uniref:hypothetical protein n=1 Tax=Pseudomonas aeruginosa TaxID=287 RepID=UPI000F53E7F8|nr:hypothetical protein [Pseudomonas aeruginosa]RPZ37426.1 hypothetical protein IPC563_05295 [Pseudomonas aeruginosa]RUG83073.1 hypothetical protein IPC561_05310 [Pseudomonas aeruginosa]RUG96550.1 hypothetical protein IPC562_05740 [Pseudomonas aeruginosa]